jgi:hypothetical protein
MILIAISLHYHVKGAFCLTLLITTVIWWTLKNTWPTHLLELPHLVSPTLSLNDPSALLSSTLPLYFDLLFLYVLTLSGLILSLSAGANLVREDGTTPRNRWIFIICGLMTVLSGLLGGPPILLSPESTAGIKAGAKTGLSSIVCGILFATSVFFAPILKAIPSAATSPVLIIVGVFLFQNVIRVDWTLIKDSVPAFCILFFIPFTYSVLQGVAMGYLVYFFISLATGDLVEDGKRFWHEYSDPVALDPPAEGTGEGAEEFLMVADEQSQSCPQRGGGCYHTLPPLGRPSYGWGGEGGEGYQSLSSTEDLERGERSRREGRGDGAPIRNRYRGISMGDSPGAGVRRVSSPMRILRQSMDGLDHGVQVNSGVLERPRSGGFYSSSPSPSSPSPHQMAHSLPTGNLTFM